MDQEMAQLNEALQAQGYRLTQARQTIWRLLVASGGHITADHLAELVRQEASGIGRMTVYRTLDLLSMLGLIRPIYQGTGAAHYVLFQDGHHHHLVCTSCDKVLEVEDCGLDELQAKVSEQFAFQVVGHLVEFYGLCAACRAE